MAVGVGDKGPCEVRARVSDLGHGHGDGVHVVHYLDVV